MCFVFILFPLVFSLFFFSFPFLFLSAFSIHFCFFFFSSPFALYSAASEVGYNKNPFLQLQEVTSCVNCVTLDVQHHMVVKMTVLKERREGRKNQRWNKLLPKVDVFRGCFLGSFPVNIALVLKSWLKWNKTSLVSPGHLSLAHAWMSMSRRQSL